MIANPVMLLPPKAMTEVEELGTNILQGDVRSHRDQVLDSAALSLRSHRLSHCSRRFSASRSLPSVLTQRLPTVGTCASARVTRLGGLRDGRALRAGSVSSQSRRQSITSRPPCRPPAGCWRWNNIEGGIHGLSAPISSICRNHRRTTLCRSCRRQRRAPGPRREELDARSSPQGRSTAESGGNHTGGTEACGAVVWPGDRSRGKRNPHLRPEFRCRTKQ